MAALYYAMEKSGNHIILRLHPTASIRLNSEGARKLAGRLQAMAKTIEKGIIEREACASRNEDMDKW